MLPLLAILVLEFGVAFLQAYVFVILVCIYLNDTLKSAGH
jgi:F0F1-type ATP synthase membrane subunit a